MFFDRILKNKKPKRIFLDYASSTPVAPEVLNAMMPWVIENFVNPSALYSEALRAKEAVLSARENIANVLHIQKDEVVFTSGGTESNNLALLGLFEKYHTKDFIPHIVTTEIEHPAILEVCHEIERRGGNVTYVPVSHEGVVSVVDIEQALTPETILISIMYVNNEIGTIQPIHDIVKMVKRWKEKNKTALPFVHTDACQAPLFLPLDILKLGVDLLTLDGIKMYGPRGMGVLCVRRGVDIHPLHFGGGQERGLRSGTENVAGIVGFATALQSAQEKREKESARLINIRDYAIEKILTTFPHAELNGSKIERLANNINICFPGLDAEFAIISLDLLGISASYSSSCRTLKEDSFSYVITSLGRPTCSESSLRFTLGQDTKKEDMDRLVSVLQKIVK